MSRDAGGLIVFFPIQNPELLRMAPELGGLPINETIFGVDSATRRIYSGGAMWLQMAQRLPRWSCLAHLLAALGLSDLTKAAYNRLSAKRCRAKTEWR
jgi:hypothetical protein